MDNGSSSAVVGVDHCSLDNVSFLSAPAVALVHSAATTFSAPFIPAHPSRSARSVRSNRTYLRVRVTGRAARKVSAGGFVSGFRTALSASMTGVLVFDTQAIRVTISCKNHILHVLPGWLALGSWSADLSGIPGQRLRVESLFMAMRWILNEYSATALTEDHVLCGFDGYKGGRRTYGSNPISLACTHNCHSGGRSVSISPMDRRAGESGLAGSKERIFLQNGTQRLSSSPKALGIFSASVMCLDISGTPRAAK
ncbi:hypothetical protein IWX49DRAFT_576866 [Phyllosticta citricarpa]